MPIEILGGQSMKPLGRFFLILTFVQSFAFAVKPLPCAAIVGVPILPPHIVPLSFDMPGLEVASLADPSHSTGATLFYFPKTARASVDIRGGSAATIETSLLSEGSYTNIVNGLVFSGGSTMGLSVTDGVRGVIFEQIQKEASFDFIPTIPGAVVYDFGGRVLPGQLPLVYPGREFGQSLMELRSPNTFAMGRTGAGMSTTVNKIGQPYWGGQGAAFKQYPWGKMFAAVALNALGDIRKDGVSFARPYAAEFPKGNGVAPRPGTNTTLSVLITDVILDRNQLKRLAMMVHTGMASHIFPFHSYYDGDVNFAVSLGQKPTFPDADQELEFQMAAADLMREAILNSVISANRPAPFPSPG